LKHGEEHLKESLAPKGQVSGKKVTKLASKKLKAKAKAKVKSTVLVDEKVDEGGESSTALVEVDKKEAEAARKRAARATRCGSREEVTEHPFLKKQVLVVAECAHEGRRGEVTAVYKVEGLALDGKDEELECNIFSTNGVFYEKLENLALVTGAGTEPVSYKLDYRRIKAPKRASIKHALEGGDGNLELIVHGTTLEQSTVAAVLTEIELRFDSKETKIVIPSIATPWGNDEAVYEDGGGEVGVFKAIVGSTKHVFLVLWSSPPAHFTYLYVRNVEGQPRHIEFKDSLPGEAARIVATKTLRNLGLIENHAEAPVPCNTCVQADGWSCGLWASRWVERQMRENRGEARLPPPSLAEMRNRANEFMCKIKDVKKVPIEKKPEAASKHYETHEPVHASFEDAQVAATACSKCLPTKAGTKGCRACMGDYFELIRQRKSRSM
jgi:hypothetical protein